MYEENPQTEVTHQAEVVQPDHTNISVTSQDNQGQTVEQTMTLQTSDTVVNGNVSEPEDGKDQWGEGFREQPVS